MISLSFQEIFGIDSQLEHECDKFKIEIAYPPTPEVSDLYQKLVDNCADPQALLDLLNNQVSNHVRSGSPDHFVNFKMSQMLNPFFNILPYILTDRAIIGQAHNYRIHINDYLSHWQSFAFQSFYKYFQHILSSKIYNGESRQWIITTIFDLLTQNKQAFSHSIVTRVRIKDKNFKDKSILHAVIKPNHEITIYSHNTCVKKGILKFVPKDENPIHQIEEYTKDKLTYSARLIILEHEGEKITADSAEHFFNEGCALNHLIWACMSTKENNFSYEAFDSIGRMIVGLSGQFIQIYYYSEPIDGYFKSLMTIARFIHRHSFIIKTLIWAIFDDAKDVVKLFKSSFPPVKYLISFVRGIIQRQNDEIISQLVDYIDTYQNDINKSSSGNPLDDPDFKHGIVEKFWDTLLEVAQTYPKSLFDMCSHLLIFSEMHSHDPNRNPYAHIRDLLISEAIVPTLFDWINNSCDETYKKCVNFVIKSVIMTAASNKTDEYSLLGFDSLQRFLEFVVQPSTKLNIKDIEMPTVLEYINAVRSWIDCIKGSAEYIQQFITTGDPIELLNSSSSFVDFPDDNFLENQLPTLKKRRTSKHVPETINLKSCETSTHHLRKFKDVPSNIVPWKTRLARDIFYSYYLDQNEDNSQCEK